jgi:hypothetical protein
VEDQYTGIFEINNATGEMFLREGGGISLDYEKQQTFTVDVIAKDRCLDGCYFGKLAENCCANTALYSQEINF